MNDIQSTQEDVLLTLITTFECEARCSHCLMRCSPDKHDRLSYTEMTKAIDRFICENGKGVVVFTGGECTRLGSALLDAIAYANTRGILTRIVTNAEWATDDVHANLMIAKLRESGLDELNVSFDDFHSEWIPVENVARAWKAAKDHGFTAVVLAAGFGPASTLTPQNACELLGEPIPILQASRAAQQLPNPSEDGTIYLISASSIARIGRGRNIDPKYCSPSNIKRAFQERCPAGNRQPVITPNNHMGMCCGLNPEDNQLIDLGPLETFSKMDEFSLVFQDIVESIGPGYFIKLINLLNPKLDFGRDFYSSACEMCEDISRSPAAITLLKKNIGRIKQDLNAEKYLDQLIKQGDQCE